MTLTRRGGLGRNLTADEFDGNTDDFDGRLIALEAAIVAGRGIDDITLVGDQLTFFMDDYTEITVTMPLSTWNNRGEWAVSTAYAVGDVFTYQGALYQVIFAHTSDPSTFDPADNDGFGNDFYNLLINVLFSTATSTNTASTSISIGASSPNTYYRCTSASAITVTFPDSDGGIPLSAEVSFRQVGAGQITFMEGGTAILNFPDDYDPTTAGVGATVTAKKVALSPPEWDVFGLLTYSP